MKFIIIVNRDGEAIGQGRASGGYACLPSHISGVQFWGSIKEAEDYADIWNRRNPSNYGELLKCPLTVKEIEIDIKLSKG